MNAFLVFPLLVAAGVALVFQNLLMVKITQSVSTVLITLAINSAVGLVLLLASLLARKGLAGLGEMVQAMQPWLLLPGLLGSFFVFAGIMGYQSIGAAATIAVLVASQLLTGMVVQMRQTHTLPDVSALLGAVLLMAGVVLILRARA
ncbi:DMT family transporter [Aquitalea denitrificans]|jgi:transporter family-2 protein|uniref:DMT family transporter n=1 Tax=Aquitalea denitrificans TaxID=519081 RepID=UPI0013576CA9|nr:DMT family transporter [Aquitalea denitrificans]